jgi:hypothetical protein
MHCALSKDNFYALQVMALCTKADDCREEQVAHNWSCTETNPNQWFWLDNVSVQDRLGSNLNDPEKRHP